MVPAPPPGGPDNDAVWLSFNMQSKVPSDPQQCPVCARIVTTGRTRTLQRIDTRQLDVAQADIAALQLELQAVRKEKEHAEKLLAETTNRLSGGSDHSISPPEPGSSTATKEVSQHGTSSIPLADAVTDEEWFASLFATRDAGLDAETKDQLFHLVTSIVKEVGGLSKDASVVCDAMGSAQVALIDNEWRERGLSAKVGDLVLKKLLASIHEHQSLQREIQGLSAKSKDANEFTFGDEVDFTNGLVGMIGMPTGLNELQ
eukprot:SAG31_NODE_1290_length_8981_cov_2.829543_4_plen_259_part_00